jgi:trk system potassium uptake protein TrkH
MLATGLDFLSAVSAVMAAINNLGPGLGSVAANYAAVSDLGKVILCVGMLLGRLEIFTLLILFTTTFWRP